MRTGPPRGGVAVVGRGHRQQGSDQLAASTGQVHAYQPSSECGSAATRAMDSAASGMDDLSLELFME